MELSGCIISGAEVMCSCPTCKGGRESKFLSFSASKEGSRPYLIITQGISKTAQKEAAKQCQINNSLIGLCLLGFAFKFTLETQSMLIRNRLCYKVQVCKYAFLTTSLSAESTAVKFTDSSPVSPWLLSLLVFLFALSPHSCTQVDQVRLTISIFLALP